ncbi:MAG: tetratricopeptide repeat protein, partial [Methanoregula sp.]|nr:tetratricopeptide repeat protein [Methanoregula sp.]
PAYIPAWNHKAHLFEELQEFDKAAFCYEESIRLQHGSRTVQQLKKGIYPARHTREKTTGGSLKKHR